MTERQSPEPGPPEPLRSRSPTQSQAQTQTQSRAQAQSQAQAQAQTQAEARSLTQPLPRPSAAGAAGGVPLFEAHGLVKAFAPRDAGGRGRLLRAVDRVDLTIVEGECLALVGESGCGKSTLGRLLVRLLEPTEGTILHRGRDVAHLRGAALKAFRRDAQVVFQDPFGSLDPRMRVRDLIAEPLLVHRIGTARERAERVRAALARVGLAPEHAERWPHEFSGGQRQRIGIARALILEPRFVFCDEPVSALDVSVQAQILNLLRTLQASLGLTCLFVSHNLAVVRQVADRVALMYLGRIVEVAPADDLFARPRHPYAQALLASVPVPDPARRRAVVPLLGEIPSALDPPSGCRFHTRCPKADARCRVEEPELGYRGGGTAVACHHA
jgi:peptide/nickel transport system ATP-binding protein/oligopeptide transport system ATP-binding protein